MKSFIGSALIALFVTLPVSAETLKVQQGSVSFLATGKPGFLKIPGSGPEVTGELSRNDKGLSGSFTVAMDKFTTGIAMRDEHMKDKYLEVAKFPTAVLTISELKLASGTSGEEQDFTGVLKLHGVEKTVNGRVSVEGKEKLKIKARFSTVISDYGIEVPRFTGITMAEKVEIEVDLLAQP